MSLGLQPLSIEQCIKQHQYFLDTNEVSSSLARSWWSLDRNFKAAAWTELIFRTQLRPKLIQSRPKLAQFARGHHNLVRD